MRAYLGSNIVCISEHVLNIVSAVAEKSVERWFIIYFAHYFDTEIFYHILSPSTIKVTSTTTYTCHNRSYFVKHVCD
jgi:hypothetical protein